MRSGSGAANLVEEVGGGGGGVWGGGEIQEVGIIS